ncbi:hypothetical protein [Mesorhizobium sp. M0898]|uniref:hypothetical protein n=1 Tax=Mesorhizobium sp. M0898 TaxID=2957020 RepID=UPI00333C9868
MTNIRTILRLTHEEGLSVREIAERLTIGKPRPPCPETAHFIEHEAYKDISLSTTSPIMTRSDRRRADVTLRS